MLIRALQFSSEHFHEPKPVKFIVKDIGDLESILQQPSLPFVYLIARETLTHLIQFDSLIVNRGVKNPHKGLGHYLLRPAQKKIPIIDGNYTSIRQLSRSIRDLLKRCEKSKQKNIFFVGADKTIFRALWERKAESSLSKDTKLSANKKNIHRQTDTFAHDTDLFQLMDHYEEPHELAELYVGSSNEAHLIRQLILHAAKVENSVLILGDTGTGKEVVARAIHRFSDRYGKKFVTVNCGAIPGELFESELFGHRKGAFTGAHADQTGLWEYADGGTLFLDEIGDLSLSHQVKILRALEDGKIRPVGSRNEIKVNARIVAATNRDLIFMKDQGGFREDLYYRLHGFFIRTPPLREHPADIPALAQFFWQETLQDDAATLPASILDLLQQYPWPGNARELKMLLINLHAHFSGSAKKNAITDRHLIAVMKWGGQITGTDTFWRAPSANHLQTFDVSRLRHLKRINEVLNVVRTSFQNIICTKHSDPRLFNENAFSLKIRLDELNMLCRKTEALKESFVELWHLLGNLLLLFDKVQNGPQDARDLWQDKISHEMDKVTELLERGIKELLNQSDA